VEHNERRTNENIVTASRPSSGSNDTPYRNRPEEREKGTTPTSEAMSGGTSISSLSSSTTTTAAAAATTTTTATITTAATTTTTTTATKPRVRGGFFPDEVSTIVSYLLTFYHLPSYSYSHRNYASTPKVMIVLSSRPTLISIVLTHYLFLYLFTNLSYS
jgi:hypothetical protein